MILKTLSAKFMIGTAGQARVDACKRGLQAAHLGAPRLQQMLFLPAQQERGANCRKTEWQRNYRKLPGRDTG
jgi:hypothetical protein